LKPSETYDVENIKSTNFILGTNTKSTKLVTFNQTTKIDTQEEKYFHSKLATIGFGNKQTAYINLFPLK
jgi:hypothetical protein